MNFIKNTILSSIAIMVCFTAIAQEEEAEEAPAPTFAVAGSVDTYFRSTQYAPGSSFAQLPGFAMGMANIIMSYDCLLYTSPSPRDRTRSRMPSSA